MKLKARLGIFILVILIIGGFFYAFFRSSILPVDRTDKTTKIFVIKRGEGLTNIVNNLAKENLIRSRLIFFIVVKQMGIEKNLQAGVYRLSPSMDLYKLSKELTHGSLDISITLLEGWRKEEIAQEISKNLDIPEVEIVNKGREGSLFPDTYFLPKNATSQNVIDILVNNFQRRFAQAKQDAPQRNNLTDDQIVVLASLIEREARFDEDRPKVANILLKRLNDGHKLQVDATVQYVLGYQTGQKRWWKKGITVADTRVDSTFNTYQIFGLPPAPICNPGLASIKAALGATGNTPYLFYINDPKTGKLYTARDSEEHQANIDKYLK